MNRLFNGPRRPTDLGDGILLHGFDIYHGSDASDASFWQPTPVVQGRVKSTPSPYLSASFVSAASRLASAVELPMFWPSLAGVVLSASHNTLRCAFKEDASTGTRPGGCSGMPLPAEPDTRLEPAGGWDWCTPGYNGHLPCAWPPKMLSGALEAWRSQTLKTWEANPTARGGPTGAQARFESTDTRPPYNQLVLDAATFSASLPHSIAAVFFTDSPGCDDEALIGKYWEWRGPHCWAPKWQAPPIGDEPRKAGERSPWICEPAARAIHAALLSRFRLSAGSVPLLRLRTRDWSEPFEAVVPTPPSCSTV